MSFVDLATLTMHRRNELEARVNNFNEKCDRAIDDLNKLKMKTQGFSLQLNCEPSELKERFLRCMKQLDEYMYLITDFNLSLSKIDEPACAIEYTPVHDISAKPQLLPALPPFNLIDALSEPVPSTSTACSNLCPPEKPKRVKTPKEEALIVFSSSSSEETLLQASSQAAKEVQCELSNEIKNVYIEDAPSPLPSESCNLPAQTMLDTEQVYDATIMHVDGPFLWIITEDPEEVRILMQEMTEYYMQNHKALSLKEVLNLNYCAFYDVDCYYRGLFLKIIEGQKGVAEIFAVDTGEIREASIEYIQPLQQQFCIKPPYARNCHLAGVDLISYNSKSFMRKQEEFMTEYVGEQCTIQVDDNTSESLGVYVMLSNEETLNDSMVHKGLARPIDKPTVPNQSEYIPPEERVIDITDCPEFDDPVEAVTGYSNRDEADICKHYKGGPEKTCFKGARCNKRHVMKHPDGWTLDRVEVAGKVPSLPLPAPGTWHRALVTCVCHYDRVYVQLINDNEKDEVPRFGVVLPAATLSALVRDMNSPATRIAYKRLTLTPAPGELVAALYPPDNNWYRAEVVSVTRADQCVELKYVDYGTVSWVKEDQLRLLEPRHLSLPMQAIRCVLAGVRSTSHQSQLWAQAKEKLTELAQDRSVHVHIIGREYDEVIVELLDEAGYSIAERLATTKLVELTEYTIDDDIDVTQKVVVP